MSDTSALPQAIPFSQLGLSAPILEALNEIGYETPSPIQAQTIPPLLAGKDVIGQAQTGTGKTAAFALPLLSMIDLSLTQPQLLILAPTRELAIQVAEACQKYASKLKNFHVAPIYGGQSYEPQMRQLKRGVHVVVGTPGRVMDHIRRGTLQLDKLKALVLDEADEMLRMGFIDDVTWVLEQLPPTRQIALFSATMPKMIRDIADQHLNEPEHITIKVKTTTAETIRQRYWPVSGLNKLDALTRLLEVEPYEGMIIFVRTKNSAVELAERLEARGHAATALTGDMAQELREKTVDQLRKGKLDILVATDVVARGLDVERITHVINYDVPYDTESYTHRIGRTGRAGRSGDAILFISPREKRMLNTIEKATRQQMELLELPSVQTVNNARIERFKQKISDMLGDEEIGFFRQLIEDYRNEHNVPVEEIAAALAKLVQGDTPLQLQDRREPRASAFNDERRPAKEPKVRGSKPESRHKPMEGKAEEGMERYRLEVGHNDNIKPSNIVGAIANEAGIDSQFIGRIDIRDDHTIIDLPEGMPKEIFQHLKKVRVSGKPMQISRFHGEAERPKSGERKGGHKKPKDKQVKGKRPAVAARKEKQKNKSKY